MNYSKKIFDVLGVKPKEVFGIGNRKVYIDKNLKLYTDCDIPVMSFDLSDILNGTFTIKKIPNLTEDDEAVIRYCQLSGYKWLTRDRDDMVYAHVKKPKKGDTWWSSSGDNEEIKVSIPLSFINWEDDEPYCIEEDNQNA